MDTFIFYTEYRDKIELLDGEQTKQLILALIDYTEKGTEPEGLGSIVTVAFRFIRDDIDRAKSKYQAAVENGKKGGAPKGNKNAVKRDSTGLEEKQEVETEQPKTTEDNLKQPKTRDREKNNLNDNVNDNELNKRVPKGTPKETPDTLIEQYSFSEPLASGVRKWLKYKAERRDSYKDTGLKALLSRIDNKAKEYGDIAVIELIDECMSNGWKGLIWDKLERGGKSPPSVPNSKKDKFNFEQRDWDFEELERIKREELLKNSNGGSP